MFKPSRLLFGTAGIPLSTQPRNTLEGIKQVKRLGLEAMELEFVRSINVSEQKAPEVKRIAEEQEVILTCHGQYWVNLNAKDPVVLQASIERIINAARICHKSCVWSLCYHIAHYMGEPHDAVYQKVKQRMQDILAVFKQEDIKIWLRPEIGGKITQFGDAEELLKLSTELEGVQPLIDFAHLHARSLGKYNTYEEFCSVLALIERYLGREGLDNMHIQVAGVEWTKVGERNHTELEQSDMNYKDLVRAWKEFNIKGVVIAESPNIEKDALLLKRAYEQC